MEIVINQLGENDFNSVKEQLVELQYENSQLHFPNKSIKSDYAINKIEGMYTFITENKASAFIAIDKNKVIGFIWCYPRVFFDEQRVYINSLIVSREYRGKKIGEKLVDSVERYAKSLGAVAVDVSTAAFNTGGLGFYRKRGFEDERVQLVKPIGDF
ncbi:GNAT family N-acetyltransferase [Halobacillus sp. Nhm2S1]|uniref:GNAT family N-acetyltransferase n=1 Tax=Halobacillus sp. Nhm2S1 TaxID=2866716 RepID=UPI001C739663|nr:GNAT family N-acetyltransferase [Halobacillus sp. Nhm2S1]MBX0357725.1 GNAT family N-acetyltransferase [Halobacillus sp. Nhm2S1]